VNSIRWSRRMPILNRSCTVIIVAAVAQSTSCRWS